MRRVDITPAIRQFVAERFKQPVLQALASPTTATIHEPSSILAVIRNPGERSGFIWATGLVDAQNLYGAMLTQDYIVVWTVKEIPDGSEDNAQNDGLCISLGGQTTTPDVPGFAAMEMGRFLKASNAPFGTLPASHALDSASR